MPIISKRPAKIAQGRISRSGMATGVATGRDVEMAITGLLDSRSGRGRHRHYSRNRRCTDNRPSGRGQGDDQPGAPRGSVGDLDRAAMLTLDDTLRNGKPQPGAAG